jgi:3-polyprenyl-4-hydroxybenzoate decarboxylase
MPLVGGGGSPNVSGGANPSGTGSGLNYIGNHVYAYSGTFASTNSATTMLNFTTGNQYIRGNMTCNAAIDFDTGNIDSGVSSGFRIKLDGQIIALLKTDSGSEDMPSNSIQEMLIPPHSIVTVERIASGTNSSFLNSVTFTGRVYA